MSSSNTYEADFHAWTIEQAALLRERRFADVDLANIIEEIESLGRGEKRELRNRLIVLMAHLLKWHAQPDRRGASWRGTIDEQRLRLRDHLEDNPSLRPTLANAIARAWRVALTIAGRQMRRRTKDLPAECPWTAKQILDEAFYPEGE